MERISRKTKSYYKKLSQVAVAKIISFIGRTYDQVRIAYENLKTRYRIKVKIGKLIPMGADLYSGSFEVA
jgi:F0F1-type ATP synthase gamma subunit